jgi:hypothetical protein
MVMNLFPDMPQGPAATGVSCPKCGTAQTAAVATVITPDDESLVQLFQGKLNQLVCEQCGTVFGVETPLLFRDDDQHVLIYYLPLGEKSEWQEAEKQMIGLTEKVFADAEFEEMPTCRLTLTHRRFIEKIAIHIHGLDDRLVEYVKYQLYNRPEQPVDAGCYDLFYDFSPQEENILAFIIFDRDTARPQAVTHIGRDLYDELEEAFLQDAALQQELHALFPGCYVSVERILE